MRQSRSMSPSIFTNTTNQTNHDQASISNHSQMSDIINNLDDEVQK